MKLIYLLLITSIIAMSSCNKTTENKQKTTESLDKTIKTEVKNTDSRDKIIKAEEINRAIAEGRSVSLQNTTILGDIDFTLSKDIAQEVPETFRHFINSSVTLVNCTVKGKIIGSKSTKNQTDFCTFNKNLTILKCTVQDSLIFTECEFKQLVNIRSSDLEKTLIFNGSRFMFKKNYFSENRFFDNVFFNSTTFEGEAIFFRTDFAKHAVFSGSFFAKTAQFGVCKFHNEGDFTNIKALDGFFFNSSEFYKPANFSNSRFSDRFELQSCKINTNLNFDNCSFFASVSYTGSELDGIVSFEKSIFHETAPNFSQVTLTEGSHINTKDALTVKKEQIVINGLIKEKK